MDRILYTVLGVVAFIFADWYVRRWLDRKYGK